jgi:hypothetical protein
VKYKGEEANNYGNTKNKDKSATQLDTATN